MRYRFGMNCQKGMHGFLDFTADICRPFFRAFLYVFTSFYICFFIKKAAYRSIIACFCYFVKIGRKLCDTFLIYPLALTRRAACVIIMHIVIIIYVGEL